MDFNKWREHWKLSLGEDIEIQKFVEDGIVNPKEWNKLENKEKILFILKEPNGAQDVGVLDGGTDLVASLRQDEDIQKHPTWRNINYWAYGLLHTNVDGPIPGWEEAKQASERSLDKVAVINLKKLYGDRECDAKELERFAENDQKFILEQIREINPDIIVTSSNMYLLEQHIIPEGELFEIDLRDFLDSSVDNKNWVNVWKLKGKDAKTSKDVLIIRHYHPGATTVENKGFLEENKYRICCQIKQAYLKSIKK